MADTGWTEETYAQALAELHAALKLFVEKGVGIRKKLLRDAEELLGLRERFPAAFERHAAVEGLVADIIARQEQEQVFSGMRGGGASGSQDRPGCLLGWLLGRRSK